MVGRAAKISTGIDLESTSADRRNRTRPSIKGRMDALPTFASLSLTACDSPPRRPARA